MVQNTVYGFIRVATSFYIPVPCALRCGWFGRCGTTTYTRTSPPEESLHPTYEKANHVLAADKDLFTISLETRLNFLIRELTWLGQVSHTDR